MASRGIILARWEGGPGEALRYRSSRVGARRGVLGCLSIALDMDTAEHRSADLLFPLLRWRRSSFFLIHGTLDLLASTAFSSALTSTFDTLFGSFLQEASVCATKRKTALLSRSLCFHHSICATRTQYGASLSVSLHSSLHLRASSSSSSIPSPPQRVPFLIPIFPASTPSFSHRSPGRTNHACIEVTGVLAHQIYLWMIPSTLASQPLGLPRPE